MLDLNLIKRPSQFTSPVRSFTSYRMFTSNGLCETVLLSFVVIRNRPSRASPPARCPPSPFLYTISEARASSEYFSRFSPWARRLWVSEIGFYCEVLSTSIAVGRHGGRRYRRLVYEYTLHHYGITQWTGKLQYTAPMSWEAILEHVGIVT
ncbi:hypothetical protein EVAR_65988_1 [Eumeta japonica]|uniref:Uncharacterized protein n=1 Tax=Eumeta variegata TaxID=151549 RepID=A0A4C1ZPN7_EUMVA|nr:hypothetical protein EVAR_65988_1 [Eumeta japonica]